MVARAGGYVDRDDGRGWQLDPEQEAAVGGPEEPVKAGPGGLPGHPAMKTAAGWAIPDEPEPQPQPEPEPELEAVEAQADGPGRPAQGASKAAWVDYAAARGFDRDDAKGMSKQDLIDVFREEDGSDG